eukprot:Colp12_sorted_trinity150504_noHs@14189
MSAVAAITKKVVDWGALTKALPVAASRQELNNVRVKYDDVRMALSSTAEEAAPVNWDHYKKAIGISSIVDDYKKMYEGTKFSKPDTSKEKAARLAAKKESDVKIAQAVADAQKRIRELESTKRAILNRKPIDELTVEDVFEENPQWKKQIEKEFADGKW